MINPIKERKCNCKIFYYLLRNLAKQQILPGIHGQQDVDLMMILV
jgi:hypothetical protein